jgi:hypothetical protein
MQLQNAVSEIFTQLSQSIRLLNTAEYKQPSQRLFNATIGQHVRHVIELFQCLQWGYEVGVVNYDNRKRNLLLEEDKDFAMEQLVLLFNNIERPNKTLVLQAIYDEQSNEPVAIPTNYLREVAYNLEHTIHHMALIRVGINEVSNVQLPENFGIASSTIKYKKICAQ